MADEGGVLHGAAVAPIGHFDRGRSTIAALVDDIGGVGNGVDGHLAIFNLKGLTLILAGISQTIERYLGLVSPAVRQFPSALSTLVVPVVDLVRVIGVGGRFVGLVKPGDEEQAIAVCNQLVVLVDLLVAGGADAAFKGWPRRRSA